MKETSSLMDFELKSKLIESVKIWLKRMGMILFEYGPNTFKVELIADDFPAVSFRARYEKDDYFYEMSAFDSRFNHSAMDNSCKFYKYYEEEFFTGPCEPYPIPISILRQSV